MGYRLRDFVGAGVLALCLGAVVCPPALAAPDEIQVYLDDIRAPGEFGIELHLNYVPKGRETPDYPGEIPPNHVFRATPEFSIGLRPNWDVGLYLPTEVAPGGNAYLDGARGRLKYLAAVETTKPFFYGANLEVGYVPTRVIGRPLRERAARDSGLPRRPVVVCSQPDPGLGPLRAQQIGDTGLHSQLQDRARVKRRMVARDRDLLRVRPD